MARRKKSRGRYGDGCVYRQKGRRIWWIAWYETIRRDGVEQRAQRFESTGSDDKDFAQRRLRSKLQALGGRRPTVVDPTKVSYEDLRKNFMEYCVLHDRWRRPESDIKVNTLPRLDSFFGGWRANEITTAQLKRFRAEGKRDGLSDARLNRYMATIRKMFNQAVRDELITRAETPSYYPTTHEPNEAKGALFIEPRWYAPLCKELKEPLRSAFILAYHWGVRVGELQRIRKGHIDIHSRVINLPGEITKMGKPRTLPLPAGVKISPGAPDDFAFRLGDIRGQWRDACVKVGAGHFECSECGAICKGRSCPTHGKRPLKKLRYRGITLRHTRHTAVRNMMDAGMDRKRAKDFSGHVTDSMFDRYNIGKKKDVEEGRELMERFHRNQKDVN